MDEEWKGNDLIFKTYVKGAENGDGKRPAEKVKDRDFIRTFEDASHYPSFGAILNQEYIDVSFDDTQMYDRFLDMAEANDWRFLALPSTHGGHTYWKKPAVVPKSGKDKKTAAGFVVDIHHGSTYIPLRVHGKSRFPPDYDIEPGEQYQELPEELWPVNTTVNLWNMKAGDGRNDDLFKYIMVLSGQRMSKDTVRRILRNANHFVFRESLADDELETITRDEAFSRPVFTTDSGSLLVDVFGDYLIGTHNIIQINHQLHVYAGGVYLSDKNSMSRAMRSEIRTIKRAQKAETLDYLQDMAPSRQMADERYIAFRNCIYDLETGSTRPFDPGIVVTNMIPHDYRPDVECALTDGVLDRLACGDPHIRDLLEECIGYCFYRSNFLNVAFIMTGDKSNGKSTFLKAMQALLGADNISSLDLKELSDRFSTAMMFGKLANIGDDISDEFIPDASQFKKITDGGRIKAEHKGVDPFEFNPYVKLLFSANSMPRVKDRTGAVLRRLIIIPFEAVFTDTDPDFDPNIGKKLRSEESMSYLINVGLRGLQRLIRRRAFTASDKVREMKRQYDFDNNPILGFIDECDVDRDILNEATSTVYQAYTTYCKENNMTALARNVFTKQICKNVGCESVVKRIGAERVRIFERGTE